VLMAAEERWYFTKEGIGNTPSKRCGIDAEKELSYRQQGANLIQDMGQRLQVVQLAINTAIVYMHRFYMYHSFTRFHRNAIAPSALFLAAKVEEQPRKLEHVIKVAHHCLHRDHPPLDTQSETYLERAQELVVNENILLQTLGFDVAIDHPHTHVVKCCQLVRANKDLAQTSYFMATSSLHMTTMCLQYKPTVVACVCIYIVCKWSNYEIQRVSEGHDWFWYVDRSVTNELLESLSAEFLAIMDKCPNRLKKIMSSGSQHGPEGGDPRKMGSSGSTTSTSSAPRSTVPSGVPSSTARPHPSQHQHPKPVVKSAPIPQHQLHAQQHSAKYSIAEYNEKRERERKERERKDRSDREAINRQAATAAAVNTIIPGGNSASVRPPQPQDSNVSSVHPSLLNAKQSSKNSSSSNSSSSSSSSSSGRDGRRYPESTQHSKAPTVPQSNHKNPHHSSSGGIVVGSSRDPTTQLTSRPDPLQRTELRGAPSMVPSSRTSSEISDRSSDRSDRTSASAQQSTINSRVIPSVTEHSDVNKYSVTDSRHILESRQSSKQLATNPLKLTDIKQEIKSEPRLEQKIPIAKTEPARIKREPIDNIKSENISSVKLEKPLKAEVKEELKVKEEPKLQTKSSMFGFNDNDFTLSDNSFLHSFLNPSENPPTDIFDNSDSEGGKPDLASILDDPTLRDPSALMPTTSHGKLRSPAKSQVVPPLQQPLAPHSSSSSHSSNSSNNNINSANAPTDNRLLESKGGGASIPPSNSNSHHGHTATNGSLQHQNQLSQPQSQTQTSTSSSKSSKRSREGERKNSERSGSGDMELVPMVPKLDNTKYGDCVREPTTPVKLRPGDSGNSTSGTTTAHTVSTSEKVSVEPLQGKHSRPTVIKQEDRVDSGGSVAATTTVITANQSVPEIKKHKPPIPEMEITHKKSKDKHKEKHKKKDKHKDKDKDRKEHKEHKEHGEKHHKSHKKEKKNKKHKDREKERSLPGRESDGLNSLKITIKKDKINSTPEVCNAPPLRAASTTVLPPNVTTPQTANTPSLKIKLSKKDLFGDPSSTSPDSSPQRENTPSLKIKISRERLGASASATSRKRDRDRTDGDSQAKVPRNGTHKGLGLQ